jgi:hypothetical protein
VGVYFDGFLKKIHVSIGDYFTPFFGFWLRVKKIGSFSTILLMLT